MDNFKKFIQEKKQGLDCESPDSRVWAQIAQHLEPKQENSKKTFPMFRWAAAAACLLVVGVSAYFLLEKNKKQDTVPTFAQKATPLTEGLKEENIIPNVPRKTENVSPKTATTNYVANPKKTPPAPARKKPGKNNTSAQYVIADVEVGNFSQVVDYQKQYISTLPIYGQKPSYFNDFKQQLRQMDNDEKEVRNDIKKHGLNSNQIELLINIYQQKITLLKQLNHEINRINKSYYQNHLQKDTAKTDNPHFLNL